jgi:hypothetical protein
MDTITLDNFDEIIESLTMDRYGTVTLKITKDGARELIDVMEVLLDEGESR